jgi:glyoxylase-like metal-dependent hydrolase (beta-lactamase superfamily II)
MQLFKFPFGPLETNSILFGCAKTKKGAVVDPSFGSSEAILQKAEENGIKIEKILLTHSHWDHFADAHILQNQTKAPIFIHPLDVKNLEVPGSDGIPFMVPIQSVKADHLIHEGDLIEVGDLKIEVIHSPGHSPGSVCFYFRDQNLLFSGDTLFKGSIGNLYLPTASPTHMWTSLRKLSELPLETLVVPGHGSDTIIGNETWLNRAQEIFEE